MGIVNISTVNFAESDMPDKFHPCSVRVNRFLKGGKSRGFALVVVLSLMILLTVIAVGLLGLASIELRKSSGSEARSIAMANARMGLMLAVGQLQSELGDDRRITADASIFNGTRNPAAVGVWNGWTPDLVTRSGSASTPTVDYKLPKTKENDQTVGQPVGFRSWLVSNPQPDDLRKVGWHTGDPTTNAARLFTQRTSGFDLTGEKIPVTADQKLGSVAWAITQENTKARINIGTDENKRLTVEDRLQTPSRPNLSMSANLKQPTGGWEKRPSSIIHMSQAALDTGYNASRQAVALAARDFTVDSYSLLTNSVKGGLKADLNTGFELEDGSTAFTAPSWSDSWGKVTNPFRATTPSTYQGQKPLFQPMATSAQASVRMVFEPATVNHKFQVNGVPTFDTLRAHYRTYRHLYKSSSGGGTTAFERPFAHIATPASEKVAGRPFGVKSQPSLAPVLDRVSFVFSVLAKADGTLCILLTPFVTVWNPHNVDIESEGLVVYPWIDLAVFWKWNVTPMDGSGNKTWSSSLSRLVGEGYKDSAGSSHGRSSRPYFYLHLTQNGNDQTATPIHLEPGEVRVFCLATSERKDLEITANDASLRTWRMKPVGSATDITSSLKGGVILNMTKSIGGTSNFNYKLKTGDVVNPNTVEFDRNTYYYIVNMADSYQIKNPKVELMVDTRPAQGAFPMLPAEKNLYFYDQVHSGPAFGKGRDAFSYPSFRYEEINENPKMVGSILTYHRVAQASTQPLADLMFTTNPRQPFINAYLSGAQFQSGPHYESLLKGGTSLTQLAMETTPDGKKAFYGPSNSANSGRSNLAFFEIPRSPLLSLGAFQHCDIAATAFGCPSQIGNSWASPYLPATSVSKRVTAAPGGETISPLMSVYDSSFLANEAIFDSCYLSGAVPEMGSLNNRTGSPSVWDTSQVSENQSVDDMLEGFFADSVAHPLRNPRMTPYQGGYGADNIKSRLSGPARCVRLAAHLMVEGGFNINSTSEEAWTAVLSSLRGVGPASSNKTAQSRFRDILTYAPVGMGENDPWSGFRTLSDDNVKLLAKNIVTEIRTRGPFLSLGEFVNRQISSNRSLNISGALQSAIDKSGLNKQFTCSPFSSSLYPNPENLPNPTTGTNTPGWLSQADVLNSLAPYITARSDTFIVRSMGEAKNPEGRVIATVRLEAVVQRVPEWIDPSDVPETMIAELTSTANRTFGRRFQIQSIREITLDPAGDPV